MTVLYHPSVQGDLNDALAYYARAGGSRLAAQFETDFRACLAAIQSDPGAFARYHASPRFRRIRLQRFPYVVLYHPTALGLRVLLLKHERRHPLYGLERH